DTTLATAAERAFGHTLAASCRTPLAAYASWRGRELWLRGLIASRDGRRVLRGERSTVVTEAGAAARLGDALGAEFLARGAAGIPNARVPATTMDSEGLLALPELVDVAGKRIVICRGDGGRELLRTALEARGATVVQVECYRRAKPQSGAEGLIDAWRDKCVDAVTLTSGEGLDILWSILGSEGREHLAATPAFVPHESIAERARE